MSEWLYHPYTILLARLVIGFVFLRSGLGKVFDRKGTVQTVITYDVLPKSIARVYGLSLPWVELILGGMLLAGLWTKLAAVILSLVLVSFAIAVSINLIRNKEMDCGCSGRAAKEKLSWRTLVRIAILFSLALAVWVWDGGYFSLDQAFASSSLSATPTLPISDFLPVLLTAILLFASVKLIEAAVEMLREHRQLRNELNERIELPLS